MSTNATIDKRLVLINSASSIGAHLLNASVLVWVNQYLLKRISPEEYAIYPVVMSVMMFAPLFFSAMTGGVARYVVHAYAKGKEHRISEIISSISPFLFLMGAVFLGLGGAFAWNIDHFLTIVPERLADARLMMVLLVLGTTFQMVSLPFGIGLYVKQRFVVLNVISVLREMLKILILFSLLFGVSTRVIWVVVASTSAITTETLARVIISHRLIPALKFRPNLFRWHSAKELMSFGMWKTIGQMAVIIRLGADTLILNKLGSAIDITALYIGMLVYTQIETLTNLATLPLHPVLTTMHATDDTDRFRNTYLRGGRYGMWVALFIACPLMVYSNELVRLYAGETYAQAATVIIVLLSVYPILYPILMLPAVVTAKAQVRSFFLVFIGMELVHITLTLYLVGRLKMGAVGAALGMALPTIVAVPLVYWPMGLRMTGTLFKKFLDETLRPGILPALVGLVVWLGLNVYSEPVGWLQLGAYTACGWVAYVGVLALFCMRPSDRYDLEQSLDRIRMRLGIGQAG